MSIVRSFFDIRENYNLQSYFENLGSDFATIIDDDGDYPPLSKQCEKLANFMGRLPIIGRVAGPIRVGYGTIKAPLCAVASVFALAAAGAYRPFSLKVTYRYLYNAEVFGRESLDGIKHIGRGIIETIPVVGCYQFVKYDNDNIMEI